jgi:hypothetical protein
VVAAIDFGTHRLLGPSSCQEPKDDLRQSVFTQVLYRGHFLTRSWDQRRWKLDNRKEEFKDLLSVLTKSFVDISFCQTLRVRGSDEMKALQEAESNLTAHGSEYRELSKCNQGVFE